MLISFIDSHGESRKHDINDLDLELWLKGYTFDWTEPITNLQISEIE